MILSKANGLPIGDQWSRGNVYFNHGVDNKYSYDPTPQTIAQINLKNKQN